MSVRHWMPAAVRRAASGGAFPGAGHHAPAHLAQTGRRVGIDGAEPARVDRAQPPGAGQVRGADAAGPAGFGG